MDGARCLTANETLRYLSRKLPDPTLVMPPRRISLSEVDRRNVDYSDAEQIVIKSGLKTTEAGLLRLNTLRSNGTARRRQLEDQIRRCNVALAPFKNIPKEIWMCIFELYCQSGLLSTRHTEQDSPVVLTQVCSSWRQIALSMPKLWNDVYLRSDVNLARMWLGRAGNIPRALETCRPPSHCSSPNRPQTIQTLISSFHFRKLHLTPSDAAGIDFTAIPVESLLLLEDLALKHAPKSISRYLEVTSLSSHHFPNLVSLQIGTNLMPHFHVSRPFATWKKLRVLQLECELDKAKCLEILRDASSVEDCGLRLNLTSFHSRNSTIENVVLANLKILRLSFQSTFTLWSFLGHFTFPNLDTLILNVSRYYVTFQPRDKLPLLRLAPRFGSLRSLILNFHHLYTDVDVVLVLECLPLLQVLDLHCAKITTDTAEKIGRGELGGCLRELRDWGSNNLFGFLQACELRRDVTKCQSPNSSGAIASLEKVSVNYKSKLSKSRTAACKRRICKLRKVGVQFEVFEGSASRVRHDLCPK